jgi:hypothetical protein
MKTSEIKVNVNFKILPFGHIQIDWTEIGQASSANEAMNKANAWLYNK